MIRPDPQPKDHTDLPSFCSAPNLRDGPEAFDRLLVLVATAAEQHACESKGRGAVGTLLGDGRRVRGRTAHREAERARTVSKLSQLQAAAAAGRIGAAQIDAISVAIKGLSDDELVLLDTGELIDAASSLPVDVFAKQIRREAERVRGDSGLSDTKQRQARSSWKQWFDERAGSTSVHPMVASMPPPGPTGGQRLPRCGEIRLRQWRRDRINPPTAP